MSEYLEQYATYAESMRQACLGNLLSENGIQSIAVRVASLHKAVLRMGKGEQFTVDEERAVTMDIQCAITHLLTMDKWWRDACKYSELANTLRGVSKND